MVLHYLQTVSKIALLGVLFSVGLSAKDFPIMKTMTVNIPLGEYSILDFPFKIVDVQTKTFNYKTKIIKKIAKESQVKTASKALIDLKRKTPIKPKGNVMGMTRGVNVLTFRPKHTGFTELIIWGFEEFPIILKINVKDEFIADKHLNFIQTIDSNKEVKKFEANSHEKIIEKIVKHLYDENYKSKPSGYETISGNSIYSVEITDENKEVIGVLEVSLLRELLGRNYIGQVWNVKIKELVDEDVSVTLYEEMFDEDGIFSVSLETYSISKEHGTRVMIVRRRG